MSRSSFGSSEPQNQPARPQEAAEAEPPRREPSLLEQALDATLALTAGGAALESPELAPFVEVARRHRGRPLTAEPVAVELVLAVLRRRFAGLSPEGLETLSRQVAQTLLDDPHARQWLETFWRRLAEAVP